MNEKVWCIWYAYHRMISLQLGWLDKISVIKEFRVNVQIDNDIFILSQLYKNKIYSIQILCNIWGQKSQLLMHSQYHDLWFEQSKHFLGVESSSKKGSDR